MEFEPETLRQIKLESLMRVERLLLTIQDLGSEYVMVIVGLTGEIAFEVGKLQAIDLLLKQTNIQDFNIPNLFINKLAKVYEEHEIVFHRGDLLYSYIRDNFLNGYRIFKRNDCARISPMTPF